MIKIAPVVAELKKYPELECLLVSTGQHDEMLEQQLVSFDLIPDRKLKVIRPNQDLTGLTSRLLEGIAGILRDCRPNIALVQGDTTTVLSAALAAFYENISVGHIEAGLRTYDLYAPWPEEMNRRLTDVISRWCFAPTRLARDNLIRDGIELSRIFVTGNTVIDALMWMRQKIRNIEPKLPVSLSDFLSRYQCILVTGHRRESFGEPFVRICKAILNIANEYENVGFVYPLHLNPKVRSPVTSLLGKHPRILLIEPLDYEAFVWLMDKAYFILTDSGGVQEEATALGKPVLVMRNVTERPEAINAGIARLVGTNIDGICRESGLLLDDSLEYSKRAHSANPYGDGQASKKIVDILRNS